MPTPPLEPGHPRWPEVERAYQIYRQKCADGVRHPKKSTAEEVGVHENTLTGWITAFERNGDPAIEAAKAAVGTNLTPKMAWAKTKNEDGTSYSVLLMPQVLPDDVLSRIREAFEGMEPAKPVRPPTDVMHDLCAVYPVCDIHANMVAHAEHTGGDEYNLDLMADDLMRSIQKVMVRTPNSEEAVLILNGDTLDTDNETGLTPKSGHVMHKDGSQFAATTKVIHVVRVVIGMLLEKHKRLTIRVLRGNHDESSHIAITMGLLGYMAQEERVTVEAVDNDLFMKQWGRSGIFAHHGDLPRKWAEFALTLSDICEFWSATYHRTCFFGHGHNGQRQDFGAINIEMLRPFAPLNSYAAGLKFAQRRALHSITFDKMDGIVTRALDPIRR